MAAVRPELPAGTVTFLFTDVEGSTRLLEELGVGYVDALAEHRRIVRETATRRGGVEVDTQGDAFFIAFADAREAVRAAAEAQSELAAGRLRVRMGVHTGEPIVWAEGYAGVDVHRGARICAAAHGGQIVVSERTASLLDGEQVRPLGSHRLKDLSAPQQLFQLGEGEFPPLRTLHVTNLPAQPSPLVGRERELEDVAALLREHTRLLTLTGAGGSGKTRLALHVAAELAEEFPDGVFFVPLAGVNEAELVLPTVEATIGARDGLADHVGDKHMLLLLDNFEQVLDAAAEVADPLRSCANLKLLVTSRAPLRIGGEREYPVEPLPESDAVRLFTERARAVAAAFEPDESVIAICRGLDGLPLAVELAAARVRILSPRQLLARLEQRLPLLTGGARDAPERQRTLRATIEWSHDLLQPDARRLFARLAVFAGSFDLETAEKVCSASLDGVESLVEQSLVRRWESGRLGMLETIREFALERLAEDHEHDGIRRAHADHFLALAEAAETEGEMYGPGWLERLASERDNFRAAMRWALDEGAPVLALRLAGALGRLWVIRARQEGYAWLEEALEKAHDAPPDVRATGLMWAASTVYFTDYRKAEELSEAALALFRQLGDKRNAAHMLDRLAAPALMAGDPAKARTLAEESLALFRELGDRQGLMYPLAKIALVERQYGDPALGAALTWQTVELAREFGDSWWESLQLVNLAEMAWEQQDLERAAALARESLSLSYDLGDVRHLFYALGLLAVVAAAEGKPERALRLWGVVKTLEEAGEARFEGEDRARYEQAVLAAADTDPEASITEGRSMALGEAVDYAFSPD